MSRSWSIRTPKKTVWLDQGIAKEKLSWFYHADQGTRTFGFPYEWFMALEQPTISWLLFTKVGLFSDTAYLDRYGFIPDTIIPGKKALPIGFAKGGPMLDPTGAPWKNPRTKQDMTGVGLTCAACHTGSFTYKDTAVVIDGGPALTNLFTMKQGMGVSLLLTRYLPGRFNRFAERILGPDATLDDREALKNQLDQVLKQYKQVKELEERVASQSVLEGYGRLDALNRIGNQVFSIDLKKPENYAGSSAPVHYPRIWNTPWFDWVQYNGSIMQPMVRNAGESLGVSAELNLTDPSKGLYKSSVNVESLFEMEQMIKGDTPPNAKDGFPGLRSPKWPGDILPPIDQKLADTGRRALQDPLPGMSPPAGDERGVLRFQQQGLVDEERGRRADPEGRERSDLAYRDRPRAGGGHARTERLRSRQSRHRREQLRLRARRRGREDRQLRLRPEEAADEPRGPEDGSTAICRTSSAASWPTRFARSTVSGRRRPIFTTARSRPSKHLLGPPEDRPKKFYLGNREYDPVNLGYKFDKIDQRFRIRHLDPRQLEHGPRIQEGIQQGQGNQGRHRAGAVTRTIERR